ncbi:hypothetical protein HELRODRAFT_160981 [Helobdella robusta]|uniref:Uncharacterized protein n=1 Tax=Helobdella robusta TaxID=6412 RepID=T1EQY5_HELRO|nr:hypothetical protein HELRODRAFT_160981 [Helobdella robusta]ESO01812.1 hypothetical protein HELRODRAFT_160981 [Helobdella robusta]
MAYSPLTEMRDRPTDTCTNSCAENVNECLAWTLKLYNFFVGTLLVVKNNGTFIKLDLENLCRRVNVGNMKLITSPRQEFAIVTELKLLFETQVSQHRFYYVIMTSLITCICIEILIGLVTVYVTHRRIESWAKLPMTKESLESLTISCNTEEKPVPVNAVRKYEVYKPLQQTTTVLSQIRPHLPFADSPIASTSTSYQKLPTIREGPTQEESKHQSKKTEVFSIKIDDLKEDEPDDRVSTNAANKKSTWNKTCCCGNESKMLCDMDILKSWHNFHFYLLYVVMVLNVFITAFGLSGESIRISSSKPNE